MRKKGENNIKPPRVKLRSARLNNGFTLGIESQTLLGLRRISNIQMAWKTSILLPVSASENGAERNSLSVLCSR
jgi:hypothetical protein